jgi:hypothetical protein
MNDTLDWVYWLRAVWECRSTLGFWCAPEEGLGALDFFNAWLTDLLHIGREYAAD